MSYFYFSDQAYISQIYDARDNANGYFNEYSRILGHIALNMYEYRRYIDNIL